MNGIRRYSRHLLIPEVGLAGQQRLLDARVLCVGAGGLGSPVLSYLAAAGVGRISVIDDDVVDITNLQRQVLFTQADVGRPKTEAAAERLTALNPQVSVLALRSRFDAENARALVGEHDVVVDTTDSFASRYLTNDACRLENKPLVSGAIFRFTGHVSVFSSPGPCYRCLFPEPPPEESVPTCAEGGVLGALAGIVGAWQATEALKIILRIGEPAIGRLLLIDALTARMREVKFASDPACELCGEHPGITEVRASSPPPSCAGDVPEITARELDAFLRDNPKAVILDVREAHERVLGEIDAAISVSVSELEARMHELDLTKTYVVACRIGSKSRWAAHRLRDAGFKRVWNLRDGLLAYATLTDGLELF